MYRLLLAFIYLSVGGVGAQAQQASRFALLIGNQAYSEFVGALKNPHNDIAVVGRALEEANFTLLDALKDATREDILFATFRLGEKLREAGHGAVGFFYYTGHGVAIGGDNVLIPKNVRNTSDTELIVHGVKLAEILDILKGQAPDAVHFVVLDACRSKLGGSKGAKGFVPVTEYRRGVVVAFSTAAGEIATDDGINSGPYAAALAEEIVKPGRNDQVIFNAVRARVVAVTQRQTPWIHDGLVGERIVFRAAPDARQAANEPTRNEIAQFCLNVASNPSVAVVQSLLEIYQGTTMATCVQARLDELRRVASLSQAPTPELPAPKLQRLEGNSPLTNPTEKVLKPNNSFKECESCPEMIVVPAGVFMMGSTQYRDEMPVHRVAIPQQFAVGKYEVTFAEWDACVKDGGCKHTPGDEGWGRGKQPVINVSWEDITSDYLPWLSRTTRKKYRLLTEAEWEYVARSGSSTKYPWGDDIGRGRANCSGCGSSWDNKQTATVGSFKPNAFGLYDLHGNVWEWVADCYRATGYDGTPSDGSAATAGRCERALRGGAWGYTPPFVRSAARIGQDFLRRNKIVGFRVARTLD